MKTHMRQIRNPDGTIGYVRISPSDPTNELQAWMEMTKRLDNHSLLEHVKDKLERKTK